MTHNLNVSRTTQAIEYQRRHFIDDTQVEVAVQYGHAIYSSGIVAYFLHENDLPKWMPEDIVRAYHGTTVVTAGGATVLTVYKDYSGRNYAKLRKRCRR